MQMDLIAFDGILGTNGTASEGYGLLRIHRTPIIIERCALRGYSSQLAETKSFRGHE